MAFFGPPISVRLKPSILILVDRVVKMDEYAESRADYVRSLVMRDLQTKFPVEFMLKGGLI